VDSLSEIYASLPDTVFDLYPADKAPEKRSNFHTGKKYWNAWTLRNVT
jgi:hypothetical protein